MKKNIDNKKEYFHISPIENKVKIINEGLKSDTKVIFVSDSEEQLALIAYNQIFIDEYSVYKILSSGITGKIEADVVGDIGSEHQFIIIQNLINPEYIIHLRDEQWNHWDIAEHSARKKCKAMGSDEEIIFLTSSKL